MTTNRYIVLVFERLGDVEVFKCVLNAELFMSPEAVLRAIAEDYEATGDDNLVYKTVPVSPRTS